MRKSMTLWPALVVAATSIFAAAAAAQTSPGPAPNSRRVGLPNSPMIVVKVITTVQTTESGDSDRTVRTETHFSDTTGRSRSELDGFILFRGIENAPGGTAVVARSPGRSIPVRPFVPNPDSSSAQTEPKLTSPRPTARSSTEELGSTTIRGVEVVGVRTTIEHPPMPGFSEDPYDIIHETWRDTNRRVVRRRQLDSRTEKSETADFFYLLVPELPAGLFDVPTSSTSDRAPAKVDDEE